MASEGADATRGDARGQGPGHAALAALDQALAGKPNKNGHAFSAATAGLTALRDELIHRHRDGSITGRERQRLAHVNSVISAVLGGHFPLGSIPWHEIEKARGWLADILAESD